MKPFNKSPRKNTQLRIMEGNSLLQRTESALPGFTWLIGRKWKRAM